MRKTMRKTVDILILIVSRDPYTLTAIPNTQNYNNC